MFKNIEADFEKGKVYCIIGKSGAGKSTLLSLISGLDTCSEGTLLYKGNDLKEMDRDDYRAKEIGVIFQGYNLLLNATARENILLSMNISGVKEQNKDARVDQLLHDVGIDVEKSNRKVLRLSGGEQQRVGIARALSHEADIIIADEPTGNLDPETQDDVLRIFKRLATEQNKCVIIVTHSKKVTTIADVIYSMSAGKLTRLLRK
ncbi:MAG: ABC transporter ATP-binding protein [Bacilli bacterium]